MNAHSRTNPSARYGELLGLYRDMHENGAPSLGLPAAKTFDGQSLAKQAGRIKGLIDGLGAATILDYGSGKGRQYDPVPLSLPDGRQCSGIADFWGVAVTCYDPGYAPFATLPEARFDGVISTDMLEHCPAEDIPWIVDEMMSFARKFLFVNAACFPAVKSLPNGENAHCTIKPPDWWKAVLDDAVARHPGLRYFAAVENKVGGEIQETMFQGEADPPADGPT